MEWLLELALIVLLVATLFHALRLERALGVLKRDRSALEELVANFNASTRQAEQSTDRLRAAADGAGRQVAKQVDAANALKDDLVFLIERGERLADRLDALVRAGKQVGAEAPRAVASDHPRSSPPEFARADYAHDDMITADSSPPGIEPGDRREEPRLRSQAERDLLRALRMAR